MDESSDKRAKSSKSDSAAAEAPPSSSGGGAVSLESAAAANIANFMGVVDLASLQSPPQPTKEEMEKILLEARKRALIAEYGV